MMTPRDREILITITRKARMVSPHQAARVWWPGQAFGVQSALRRLKQLTSRGWAVELQVFAQPMLNLVAPIVTWQSGMEVPDFNVVSRSLFRRSEQTAQRIGVFAPTPLALHYFGCHDRPLLNNDCHVTHDLHVTEVYLRYHLIDPGASHQWIGEDTVPSIECRSQPDALLVDEMGRPQKAIEFGGRYPASRLAQLHHDLASLNLPYEVW